MVHCAATINGRAQPCTSLARDPSRHAIVGTPNSAPTLPRHHHHHHPVCLVACVSRDQTTALKELDYRNSELQELVMEKEAALEAQQLDFDRKRTALEMKHSEATDWLFRVTCACPFLGGW